MEEKEKRETERERERERKRDQRSYNTVVVDDTVVYMYLEELILETRSPLPLCTEHRPIAIYP